MERVLKKQEFLIICVEIVVTMTLLVNLMKNAAKLAVVQNVFHRLLVDFILEFYLKQNN